MKSLIVTGNGLGRAVDNDFFNLATAIKRIWDDHGRISEEARGTISSCIPRHKGIEIFEGEHDLDLLHRARNSCGILKEIAPGSNPWLSDGGINLPKHTAHFITCVAASFQNTGLSIPDSFVDPLVEYLHETNSHVATLNYDDLLYIPLIDREILCGFNTLVDGFWVKKGGFSEENLKRKNGNTFGYYLHLHGSPLFVGNNKIEHSRVGLETSEHIVLTHIQHKREVISSSEILSAYWSYLDFALSEVRDIVVIGYGGSDVHLNERISRYSGRAGIKIRVVERTAEGSRTERIQFWRDIFQCGINLIQVDNILEFTQWK